MDATANPALRFAAGGIAFGLALVAAVPSAAQTLWKAPTKTFWWLLAVIVALAILVGAKLAFQRIAAKKREQDQREDSEAR